jgi:hypothetical protein
VHRDPFGRRVIHPHRARLAGDRVTDAVADDALDRLVDRAAALLLHRATPGHRDHLALLLALLLQSPDRRDVDDLGERGAGERLAYGDRADVHHRHRADPHARDHRSIHLRPPCARTAGAVEGARFPEGVGGRHERRRPCVRPSGPSVPTDGAARVNVGERRVTPCLAPRRASRQHGRGPGP